MNSNVINNSVHFYEKQDAFRNSIVINNEVLAHNEFLHTSGKGAGSSRR